ncbi:MAG: hypothetical protein ACR2HN_00200 [Tepidiformaceae bacterium]
MRLWKSSRRLMTFGAAFVIGVASVTALVVIAQESPDPAKRKAQGDLAGPAFTREALPPGVPVGALTGPITHGQFLIYPVGQDPVVEPGGEFDGWSFEQTKLTSEAEVVPLVFPRAPQVPAGYVLEHAGVVRATNAQGETVVTEAAIRYGNGVNFPITVGRWRPAGLSKGSPYPIANPEGGLVMLTLGDVNGRPAVFVHKRPGVTGNDIQEVFVVEGSTVILVEGYVERFTTLLEVAKSIVASPASPGAEPRGEGSP